jgi:muramoyltetrapeptide carboxypeptidase
MPITVPRATKEAIERYANLFWVALAYDIPTAPMNKIGKATGELVGGNLSILYSLYHQLLIAVIKFCLSKI